MSLRVFHMIFVIVCVILAGFVGFWGLRQYQADQSTSALALAVVFLLSGLALVVYGVRVFRKLRAIP